jgi:hypothetical protein
MLVKTAHKNYPRNLLQQKKISRGEWSSASGVIEGVPMQAVRYQDLKDKQLISTCSTILPGEPRSTKHHGYVARPQVASEYLKWCAGIDIHNHVRNGSMGLEDVWMTKTYIHRQFAGVLGFVFSNAYLATKSFMNKRQTNMKHTTGEHTKFKMHLCNQLVQYQNKSKRIESRLQPEQRSDVHNLVPLSSTGRKQSLCFYCYHGNETKYKYKTSYYCAKCGIDKPLCQPSTGRGCFLAHVTHGMPNMKYRSNQSK